MTFLLPLAFFFASAQAQLENPILDGRCGKIILKIQNDIIRAEIPKKDSGRRICTFRPVHGDTSQSPVPNAMIYLVPVTCDGKMNGAPGFDLGNVSMNSYLRVIPKGDKGAGVFSVYSDLDAATCRFKVLNWKRVEKLAIKRK